VVASNGVKIPQAFHFNNFEDTREYIWLKRYEQVPANFEAVQPGKYGWCVVCRAAAAHYCVATQDPVCGRKCKFRNLDRIALVETHYGAHKDEDENGGAKSPQHKETAQEHKQHLKDEQKKDKDAEKASAGSHQCAGFQRTSKLKRPKRKDTNQLLAEDEDKQEELVKKICLLVKHNTPFNVIADTLDISPATVQQFIFNAALGTLAEHCDIDVEEGFFFLLDNPRKAKVHLGVFRSVNGGSPELLGEMDYSVGQLLGTSLLSQDLEDVPLVGDHPGAKISARFQLRTVFMGDGGLPLGSPAGAKGPGGPSAVPVVFVPGGAPQPQRVSFLDRVGREKVQVDGIWEESDEERG